MRLATRLLCSLALGITLVQQTAARGPAPQTTASSTSSAWTTLGSLIGTWSGEGTGDPGSGSGGFSFAWDLQQKILVRRNHADYPATAERPAFSHQDLMVVYREPDTGLPKAMYFDNEGHVIEYAVTTSQDAKSIVFLSEMAPSKPRYRLTYWLLGAETVRLTFEIAPPDKPDSFKQYIEARARRQ